MAHGDAREGNWRGNWRMEWVPSTLHTTTEHVVSSITSADAHTSASSSQLNWPHPPNPAYLNGLVRFAGKTKSGFCACVIITFQTQSTVVIHLLLFLRAVKWVVGCEITFIYWWRDRNCSLTTVFEYRIWINCVGLWHGPETVLFIFGTLFQTEKLYGTPPPPVFDLVT